MNKVPLPAGAASGAWFRGRDLRVFITPKVEREQRAAYFGSILSSHQKLERLCGSDRGHEIHRRVQNPRGFAGLDHAARRVGKDTGQAGGFSRHNVKGHAVASDRGGINPRAGMPYGIIVNQISSLEIVCSIEDYL